MEEYVHPECERASALLRHSYRENRRALLGSGTPLYSSCGSRLRWEMNKLRDEKKKNWPHWDRSDASSSLISRNYPKHVQRVDLR